MMARFFLNSTLYCVAVLIRTEAQVLAGSTFFLKTYLNPFWVSQAETIVLSGW